jgi:serine/threonine protein kinase
MPELSANALRRVDLICDAFDRCCRDGQQPRIEDYLADSDLELLPALREELIRIELEWRARRNQLPTLRDIQERFPECADNLSAWLSEAQATAASLENGLTTEQRLDPVCQVSADSVAHIPGDTTQPVRVPKSAPADSFPAGLTRHPRYRVLKTLGQGGMGAVYLAEHKVMKRPVALKVIRPELAAQAGAMERFRREVEAAARLIHPNIVAAHDAEQAGDSFFLVLEYVEGIDLACWLRERGPLPASEGCDYIRQAAQGLQCAHEQGMVHRDLKPHNLMRTGSGQIKILDFGLARLARQTPDGGTASGVVLGTADYMAPEQANDARGADVRADIYSLGCTLYQLLSGQVPFPGGGLLDKLRRHDQEQPASLARLCPALPSELVRVVERMMAKNPALRYQTPAEVVAALEPFCRPTRELPARPSRGLWWITSAGLLAALVGVIGLALVLRVETEHGTLEITSEDPHVQVALKQGGKQVEILDTRARRTVVLKTGKYELELIDNGRPLELTSNQITLTRQGEKIAVVKRVPTSKTPPREPVPEVPGFGKLTPVIDEYFTDPTICVFDPTRGRRVRGILSGSNIEVFFENGCSVTRFPDGTSRYSYHYHDQRELEDFACLITGRIVGRDNAAWSLLIARNPKRVLAIHIWNKGEIEVTRAPQAADTVDFAVPQVGPLRHPAIHPGDRFNTLLVTLRGRSLTILANGEPIGKAITLPERLGPINQGFGVIRFGQGEIRGEWSRFILWRLPPPELGNP